MTIECDYCKATGIKVGLCKDSATICPRCKGTGGIDLEYQPFTGRKLVAYVVEINASISYSDFLNTFPEKKQCDPQ